MSKNSSSGRDRDRDRGERERDRDYERERERDRERKRRYSRSRSRSPKDRPSRNGKRDERKRDRGERDIRDFDRRRDEKRRRPSPTQTKSKEYEREKERHLDREREREKEKERERDRERERERQRELERQREKDQAQLPTKSPTPMIVINADSSSSSPEEEEIDKEEEQRRLELEMIKRRERIERWRAERKLKEIEANKKDIKSLLPPSATAAAKKWSLEDESEEEDNSITVDLSKEPDSPPSKFHRIKKPKEDDDDEKVDRLKSSKSIVSAAKAKIEALREEEELKGEQLKKLQKEEEEAKNEAIMVSEAAKDDDEIDPLDAYMQEVAKEVRQINHIITQPKKQQGVVILTGAKKKTTVNKDKGELIEQNMDSLEYSSEEELEDIKDTAASLANKHRKELAKIDHSGVEYAPFRKNFYVEVPELVRMTQQEVEKYRTELEGIQVKGKGCPKPIKTWAQCGVSKKEMDILRKLGFEKPTPIQCQAIPAIMSGRDLIGIAKTGSGKTLAFILPMFRHILDQPHLEDGDGPISVIMAPTRELCMQIGKDIRKFSKSLNVRVVCVYGGTGISEQIAELKRGAEIIVCTPGRMIDMLAANSGRVTNLRRVTYIVLDEADRMFDMGFEPQVMRIIDNVRPDRQTVMFSATFPRQMEALARRILKKPIEVIVGGRSIVCKDVEQHVAIMEDEAKFFKLLELLGIYQEKGSIIVFVDKQENADILLKDLMKASYPCMSLHGGIDQFDRDSTILDFKSGKVRLLIATSVAARGLDVKDLILVVNYDVTNHYEDYVHRCGRTGRAGKKGSAWTFLTPEQGRYAGDIIRAFELSETPVPEDLQKLWNDYKASQEAEGKKVHTGGGFSGKGFKFDEQEANAAKESKKLQKAALGLADSDDEEDIEQDIDQQIEQLFAAKRTVKDTSMPTPAVTMVATTPAAGSTVIAGGNNVAATTAVGSDKLELAKRLASKISTNKNLGADGKASTQVAAEAILKGSNATQPMITARSVVEQLAAKLNNKLNYQPKDDEESSVSGLLPNQANSFTKYEEELEINDFPQQARWKVTSKEALAQISEYSEAGLTVRGTYVPNGKNPPEGERKLYLAIESCSELAVQKAKREITRLIKEELLKLSSAHHVFNKGRYKVL
ncbi:probable ATP-dependent RNA helicase DDX46 isoform X1 [Stomoxys calcitrans]|uniref:Probable ATP-dependent RNA helicase DDX46 n=1 Tax=Stomoxys calcitrans TaxID=35570 RepID=A0A1I8PR44_STOCA|nr:probable ATP-dependent RNA helicase DDX46 isoform X1 [Stomoxys calcitrans]